MSRQLLLRCYSSNDFCSFRYAVLVVTDELLEVYAMRRAAQAALREKDMMLSSVEYFAGEADFLDDTYELESVLDEEQMAEVESVFDDNGYVFLPVTVTYEAARTESDCISFGREDFSFSCYPKHSDFKVETVCVPYSYLFGEEP